VQPLGHPVNLILCQTPDQVVTVERPSAGTTVPLGSAVDLTESTGRDPGGHLCVVR